MKRKDIRVGKKVYLVTSVGGTVEEFTVNGVGMIDDVDSGIYGSFYASGVSHHKQNDWIDNDAKFFFRDFNISGGGYNNHKAFFTPQAAGKYAMKYKNVLPNIDHFDDYDYAGYSF